MAHEGVPLPIIQRQLGRASGSPRSTCKGSTRARSSIRPSSPAAGHPSQRRTEAITQTRPAVGRRTDGPPFSPAQLIADVSGHHARVDHGDP
jgi:hypothetical protein